MAILLATVAAAAEVDAAPLNPAAADEESRDWGCCRIGATAGWKHRRVAVPHDGLASLELSDAVAPPLFLRKTLGNDIIDI